MIPSRSRPFARRGPSSESSRADAAWCFAFKKILGNFETFPHQAHSSETLIHQLSAPRLILNWSLDERGSYFFEDVMLGGSEGWRTLSFQSGARRPRWKRVMNR